MAKLLPLFARLCLFARATPDAFDAFDLRLTRIGTREARTRRQCPTFRNQPSRRAGAALS